MSCGFICITRTVWISLPREAGLLHGNFTKVVLALGTMFAGMLGNRVELILLVYQT